MKLFLQKNAKFSSTVGAPPKNFRALGASLCPQTPIGLRRLGLLPQIPKTASPIANFWLRACTYGVKNLFNIMFYVFYHLPLSKFPYPSAAFKKLFVTKLISKQKLRLTVSSFILNMLLR